MYFSDREQFETVYTHPVRTFWIENSSKLIYNNNKWKNLKTIRRIIIGILTYNLSYPRFTHISALYLTVIESNDTHNRTTDSLRPYCFELICFYNSEALVSDAAVCKLDGNKYSHIINENTE